MAELDAVAACVRILHGWEFRIIIIHQLINVADNIADVSRMPIRFREKDESHLAEMIRRRLHLSALNYYIPLFSYIYIYYHIYEILKIIYISVRIYL